MIARNGEQLKDAIIKKFEYRESNDKLNNIEEIMQAIRDDEGLKKVIGIIINLNIHMQKILVMKIQLELYKQ